MHGTKVVPPLPRSDRPTLHHDGHGDGGRGPNTSSPDVRAQLGRMVPCALHERPGHPTGAGADQRGDGGMCYLLPGTQSSWVTGAGPPEDAGGEAGGARRTAKGQLDRTAASPPSSEHATPERQQPKSANAGWAAGPVKRAGTVTATNSVRSQLYPDQAVQGLRAAGLWTEAANLRRVLIGMTLYTSEQPWGAATATSPAGTQGNQARQDKEASDCQTGTGHQELEQPEEGHGPPYQAPD